MTGLRVAAISLLAVAAIASSAGCSGHDERLKADFRWDMDNGESSGTACDFSTTYFHDESTGDPTSWLWELPDGSTSSDRNPVIDTPEPAPGIGFSSVTLTVRRGKDEDTITKDYVPNHC